ncbi:filamentous hemagglutinin N-terminal domain-containing protein [Moorena sp. SIO1G6]|uniref:two-partner secretion domain-containing protein n=1 Tax=Moorena sp. SIO1G6 TaxID=2607840 RepID=UPI00257A96B7|nr:filamentous hemagglutinin N-terminal domain-containing protein [Moorena sp. SIO1G6]
MKAVVYGLLQASPFVLCSLLAATTALGQITPDNTLGNERSVVTPNVTIKGALADLIEGGAIRDSNLFHSFSDFNVGEMGRVYFANPAGIENILSRVTGGNVSNILGTLGVLGNANLFLINPNGIVFGPNSRLDLGGSFFGSTADSVLFDNGFQFSATNPDAPPLLTIKGPLGLQYGENSGSIRAQGISGVQSFFQGLGLRVQPGKTLALVGSDITLEGFFLEARGGRIELGSVAGPGMVSLTPKGKGWVLGYEGIENFRDIGILRSFISTSVEEQNDLAAQDSDGAISIRGSQLDIGRTSTVRASTFTSLPGGDINIDVRQLTLRDGASVLSNAFDEGKAGNVTVNASESVKLIDGLIRPRFPIPSTLSTSTFGAGDGGDILINTDFFLLQNGGQVTTNTFGQGDGGNLIVDADSTVQVIGTSASGGLGSGLKAETFRTGKAGNVTITTGKLMVSDEAFVSASTMGLGDGGDVSITTGELIVKDGAVVSTSTIGERDGGNLTVDASESVQVIGTSVDGGIPSTLTNLTEGKGDAGEFLKITTGELIISDGAVVSARSMKKDSSAGTVEINANSIFLNNDGRISAETAGPQGNIELEARDIRLLDESNITTNAQNATGGNIFIDTDTLVGLENSDITANAEFGPGGSVTINAQGIFGLEFRVRQTDGNDITATSNLGPSFSGEVILNTPDVDPTSGLTELPASLVDAEAILANDLCGFENNKIAGGSSFTIIGKGGLPPTRRDPLINIDRTVGWRTRPGSASTRRQKLQQQPNVRRPQPAQEKKVIIEAQGWVRAKDGTIILTAQPFRGTPVEQILPHLDCHSGIGSREQGAGSREE